MFVKTLIDFQNLMNVQNFTFNVCPIFNVCLNFSNPDSYSTFSIHSKKLHHKFLFKFQDSERIDFSFNPYYEPEFKWFDRELLNAVRSDEENAHSFFRLLALCHTVMPDQKEGKLEYQAQSPDEAALVSAARNFGFVFKSRTPNSISIEVKGKLEVSEL